MTGTVQLELDFQPGLTEQFPELIDLVASVVYGSRIGLKGCAAALDMSPSNLSRILSRRDPDDVRHFDIGWISPLIQATDDRRPISWLIEKHLEDPETKRKQLVDQVATVLPLLQRFVEQETRGIPKIKSVR